MNKEPTPNRQQPPLAATLAELNQTTIDSELVAQWQEGLDHWGTAFVAYAQLGDPALHTPDVLAAFEDAYVRTFNDVVELATAEISAFGWDQAFERFRREQSLPVGLLIWDHEAVLRDVENYYRVVPWRGQLHVFSR